MTSPSSFMKDHWAILSRGEQIKEHEQLYTLLLESGIRPREFIIYAEMRAFIASQGLSEIEPIAFHNGRYVGTLNEVARYLGVPE